MSKKISLYGINKNTASIFEIEIKDKRAFSNPALKDLVLVTGNKNKDAAILKKHGARGFFKKVGREFSLSVEEIEQDIDKLYNRMFRRGRK